MHHLNFYCKVRRAAFHAMWGALPILRPVFCGKKESRDQVMTIVCNACKDNDINIQTDALLALVKIAEEYYDEINQDDFRTIWNITSPLITNELVHSPVIEFWSTIAEVEREKHIQQNEVCKSKSINLIIYSPIKIIYYSRILSMLYYVKNSVKKFFLVLFQNYVKIC